MNQNTTIDVTDRVIAAMLTENTGHALCDSGDAYGRNYERNAGKTAIDFLNAPMIEWGYAHEYYILSLFHVLRNNVTYNRSQTRKFVQWAAKPENDGVNWLILAEEWAKRNAVMELTIRNVSQSMRTYHSYDDDNALSQAVQYSIYHDEFDRTMCILSVHGGCDIRGGYTQPRVFEITSEAGSPVDEGMVALFCTNPECEWVMDFYGSCANPVDRDGCFVDFDMSELARPKAKPFEGNDEFESHCPVCDAVVDLDVNFDH